MKKLILGIFTVALFTSSSPSNYETFSKNNRENDKEWESLFDGKSLKGWHRYNLRGIKPIWTSYSKMPYNYSF